MTTGSLLGKSITLCDYVQIHCTNNIVLRSSANIPSFSLKIDLGEDEGRPGRTNQLMTVEVKQTCKVRMEALKGYLEKKIGWDNSVLECISKWIGERISTVFSRRMSLTQPRLP